MRSLMYTAMGLCCLLFASAAHADSTYTFQLNETSGTLGSGSGSFEINTAPTGAQSIYISTNTVGDILDSLSFSIDGYTFNLSDATGNYGLVEFKDIGGVQTVDDIAYSGSEEFNNYQLYFSLVSGDLSYTFENMNTAAISKGTISDIELSSPTPTPEPSSIFLLGTGLLAGGILLRRRRLA